MKFDSLAARTQIFIITSILVYAVCYKQLADDKKYLADNNTNASWQKINFTTCLNYGGYDTITDNAVYILFSN